MLNILCFLCSSCEECRSRKRCPHVCVFRGIGEKHPRDWLLLFADPISYTFEDWNCVFGRIQISRAPVICDCQAYLSSDKSFKGGWTSDNNMLFQPSAHKTVCDQISLHLPRLSPHCPWIYKTGTFEENPKEILVSRRAPFWKFPLQFQPQREIRGSRRNGRFNSEIFLTKASPALLCNLKMESRAENTAVFKRNQEVVGRKILQYLAAKIWHG